MTVGWTPFLLDEIRRVSCVESVETSRAVLQFTEAVAIMERFGYAGEFREAGGQDTVAYRYRVFPENQRGTPPDQRVYLLNDASASDFYNRMIEMRVVAENEASREPEPFERHTIRRKML